MFVEGLGCSLQLLLPGMQLLQPATAAELAARHGLQLVMQLVRLAEAGQMCNKQTGLHLVRPLHSNHARGVLWQVRERDYDAFPYDIKGSQESCYAYP